MSMILAHGPRRLFLLHLAILLVIAGPARSQPVQRVEVRVELDDRFKNVLDNKFIGKLPRWEYIANEAAEEIANNFTGSQRLDLYPWDFGRTSSLYDLVLKIEEGIDGAFWMAVSLEIADPQGSSGYDLIPVSRQEWCKAGDPKVRCKSILVRLGKDPEKAASHVLASEFSRVLKLNPTLTAEIAKTLEQKVPIASGLRWDRQEKIKGVTPLSFDKFIYLEKKLKHPLIWCTGEGVSTRQLLGEWLKKGCAWDPQSDRVRDQVSGGSLCLKVYAWNDVKKADPQPINGSSPNCGEDYNLRRIFLLDRSWHYVRVK